MKEINYKISRCSTLCILESSKITLKNFHTKKKKKMPTLPMKEESHAIQTLEITLLHSSPLRSYSAA